MQKPTRSEVIALPILIIFVGAMLHGFSKHPGGETPGGMNIEADEYAAPGDRRDCGDRICPRY